MPRPGLSGRAVGACRAAGGGGAGGGGPGGAAGNGPVWVAGNAPVVRAEGLRGWNDPRGASGHAGGPASGHGGAASDQTGIGPDGCPGPGHVPG
jgi:hypothetical protein